MSEEKLELRSGGKVLVEQLIINAVDSIFCVPGESFLEILDALYDKKHVINLYNARHEAGAANMAEAYGKVTGKPGIALVTRGPGACHASIGIHVAHQDSTPMILLVGQVSQNVMDRESFQEINYTAMFGKTAKWVAEIKCVERIPEYVSRAFKIASSGRPGPVVLSLPEDILESKCRIKDYPKYRKVEPKITTADLNLIEALLKKAKKPLVLLGGSGWTPEARTSIGKFANKFSLPVITSFRRQDLINNRLENFVGTLGTSVSPLLLNRVKESDLIFVLGARLSDMSTQNFSLLDPFNSDQKIIQVYPDANEMSIFFNIELGVISGVSNLVERLLAHDWKFYNPVWKNWLRLLRLEYQEDVQPFYRKEKLNLSSVFEFLDSAISDNSIITLDAGNHTGWPQRYLKYGNFRRQISSTCGAMGYSLPAAIASSLIHPDRLVISFVGDGGFMMSGLELSTAIQYGLKPIIIIFNNGTYGTIRMHQEKEHPFRVIGTDLKNPDFVNLAISLGAFAEKVSSTEEFIKSFKRAIDSEKAAVLELITDQEIISSRTTIKGLQNKNRF